MTLLKGNYKLQKTVTKNKPTAEEKLEILLEKKAHKKLGGSMVYVSKKKVNWDLKPK
jgi:hypothetical protein